MPDKYFLSATGTDLAGTAGRTRVLWSGRCAVAEYAFEEPNSLPRWTLPENTEVTVTEDGVIYRDVATGATGELSWPWPQHLRVQPGSRDTGRAGTVTQIQLVCAGPHDTYPALVFAGGEVTTVRDADRLANVLRQTIARYRVEHAAELGVSPPQVRMLSRLVIGPEFNNYQGGEGQTISLLGARTVEPNVAPRRSEVFGVPPEPLAPEPDVSAYPSAYDSYAAYDPGRPPAAYPPAAEPGRRRSSPRITSAGLPAREPGRSGHPGLSALEPGEPAYPTEPPPGPGYAYPAELSESDLSHAYPATADAASPTVAGPGSHAYPDGLSVAGPGSQAYADVPSTADAGSGAYTNGPSFAAETSGYSAAGSGWTGVDTAPAEAGPPGWPLAGQPEYGVTPPQVLRPGFDPEVAGRPASPADEAAMRGTPDLEARAADLAARVANLVSSGALEPRATTNLSTYLGPAAPAEQPSAERAEQVRRTAARLTANSARGRNVAPRRSPEDELGTTSRSAQRNL